MNFLFQHNEDVASIQAQMREFYRTGTKVKIFHGSTNSTRAQNFEKGKYVDTSRLNRILEVNIEENFILVEPNVPMDKLVDEALKYNMIPPVVMEFPGITVGGGIQGGSGESSSFKYGLFHDTCMEYEMVIGNGDVITVSSTKNEDLFHSTACSYGSLGIITLVKLRIIPVKKFVKLQYIKVYSFRESVEIIDVKTKEKNDFVDGVMFSEGNGVVMIGNFTDERNLPTSSFSKFWNEWFYLHAEKVSSNNEFYEEIIPVKEYLFRYDRGGFWMGRHAFQLFHIPFIKLTRILLNCVSHTRTLYRFLHSTNLSQKYFVQDISLPKDKALNFLEYADNFLGIYPLWLCPLRPGKNDSLSPNAIETDLVINVGIWGKANNSGSYKDFISINKEVEKTVKNLGGRKVLYAHSYYEEGEFWNIYNRSWYEVIRTKYFASSVFPDVYNKIKVSEQYKPNLFLGVIKAILKI